MTQEQPGNRIFGISKASLLLGKDALLNMKTQAFYDLQCNEKGF